MDNQVIRKREYFNQRIFELVSGDLTTEMVDAIVNPANDHLDHGGGVAGLIVRRGGYQIQAESDAWVREHGLVSHQKPAYTAAGRLPCRFVIHAVGPVWGSGDEDQKLTDAVTGSLAVAAELKLASLSLPAISTGIFGFPVDHAAPLIMDAIDAFLVDPAETSLRRVRLVLHDQRTLDVFRSAFDRLFAE